MKNKAWKLSAYSNSSEECIYEANSIITLKIHKYPEGVYRGFIERTQYMLDHIAETKEYTSFDECREALVELVKEMCGGFDSL